MPHQPLPPPGEPPLDAFLHRAAPIITSERGLSPKARILLDTMARQMGLSPAEFQQAIAIIQRGAIPNARPDQAARESFREFLRVQFEASVNKIISANLEQALLSVAQSKLGLQLEVAREELRSLASEMGLKRVSREEAERFVEGVIAKKVEEVETLDSETFARFHALGQDWGLEVEAVEEIITYVLEEKQTRAKREISWNKGMLGGAAATVLLVIGMMVFMTFSKPAADSLTPNNATANTSPGSPDAPRTTTRIKPPSWWDAEIAVGASTAKQEISEFSAVYDAIISAAPERRGQGYELLLERAAQRPFDTRKWQPFAGLIGGCYVLEPDEAAANLLLKQTSRMIQGVFEKVPAAPSDYEMAFRPFDALVKTLRDTRLSSARAAKLQEELEHLAHRSFTPGQEEKWDRGRSFLAAALMEKLPEVLPARPEVLTGHYSYLASIVREHAAEELAERQAMLVATAIEKSPNSYPQWKMLAAQAVEVRNPLALLRIVDAWDESKRDDLREDLGPRLLARVGLLATNIPPAQVAARIRETLGIQKGITISDKSPWAAWEKKVTPLLGSAAKASPEPADRLRDTVDLAWHVNLTMLLVRESAANTRFAASLKIGSPVEQREETTAAEPRAAAKPANPNRINADQQQTLQRYAVGLEDPALDEPRRVSYLRGLAKLAEQLADVPPSVAQPLAKYLFALKSESEQTQVLDALMRLRRWKQLRLAVADELENSEHDEEQIRSLLLPLTGRDPNDNQFTPAAMRIWLLQNVLLDLTNSEGQSSRETALETVNQRSKQLVELYRERARLWGVPPSEASSSFAAELLKSCVQRLRPIASTPGTLEVSSRMLELTPLLAQSDLQRTVLIQRVFVTRSAEIVGQQSKEQQIPAQRLAREFLQRSLSASDALTQLRDGEQTLLSLWMLLKP